MKRNWFQCLAVLIVLALLGAVAYTIVSTPGAREEPLPNPNGYEDLLHAANGLTFYDPDLKSAASSKLRSILNRNSQAIQTLRLGLSRPCRVPVEYTPDWVGVRHQRDLGKIKRLARLLGVEGELYERGNQLDGAIDSYLDIVRLGEASSRGGLLIDEAVGISIDAVGMGQLRSLEPKLTVGGRRRLAAALGTIDTRQEPWEHIREREKAFERRRSLSRYLVYRIGRFRTARQTDKIWESRYLTMQARRRLFIVELALHSYQSEKGAVPGRLQDLVPAYVATIPLDPFNGNPPVYRVGADGYQLYSVGPNRVDDGGMPRRISGRNPIPDGDLFLDSRW